MNVSKLNYSALLKQAEGFEYHINIFGCGVCAYYIARDILMHHKNIIIEHFIVSGKELPAAELFGIPVIPCEFVAEKNIAVLISTREHIQTEIFNTLSDVGFTYIYSIEDNEYQSIRKNCYDSDGYYFGYINRTEKILNEIAYNDVYYTKYRAFHEKDYKKEFEKLRNREDYPELVANLVKGLDKTSRQEIYRILHRLNCLCDDIPIRYCYEEKEKIKKIREEFYSKAYNIGCNLIYDDYILPCGIIAEPSVFFYKNGYNMIEFPEYIHGKAIIDAGGYIGDSALVLRRELSEKIYSFEFDSKNISLFKKVMEWNKLENVEIVELALAEKSESKDFFFGGGSGCVYNSIHKPSDPKYQCYKKQVECISIDNFAEKNNLKIGLIKSDVEGAERQLIMGAANVIRTQHPILLISIYHSIDDLFYLKPLIEKIYDGYRMKIFRPVLEHSFLEETMLVCEPKI